MPPTPTVTASILVAAVASASAASSLATRLVPGVAYLPTAKEQAYLANPTDIGVAKLPAGCLQHSHLCIIFHGAGGLDRETADLEARIKYCDAAAGLRRTVVQYDWKRWLGGQDRAAFDGQAVGAQLGAALRRAEEDGEGGLRLSTVHAIGTSVGAFAADSFCAGYVSAASAGGARATVRETLCDPFTARPGEALGSGWGLQHFGQSADFAEQIMNTDDVVPSTNVPVPRCYVLDVTRSALRRRFRAPDRDLMAWLLLGHNWPMGWLARTYEVDVDGSGAIRTPLHSDPDGVGGGTKARGRVVKVA